MQQSPMELQNSCAVCGAAAPYRCGRCSAIAYCSRAHQRDDYAEHSIVCRNYAVTSSLGQGQQMVATCTILPGNLVLKEDPLLIGPVANSDLVCLNCYSPISQEDFYKCPDCLWPMCSKECAFAQTHSLECDVLSEDTTGIGVPKTKGETPRYDLIMLLRGLLLKKRNPEAYKCLMSMESHAELRKKDGDPFHNAAVRYFTEVCKADFTAEEIHQVRGAILTNCLVIRCASNTPVRALYSQMRLFNHSCTPNIHITTSPNGEVEARAAVRIEKNEPMNICYTGTMEPLWKRQQYLTEVYKFRCQCKRCLDPTELGTYFSSPRCPDCRRSFMVPPGDGTVDMWICESCGLKYEFIDVMQEVSEWLYRIDMNDVVSEKTPKQLAKEVYKLHDSFNELHYVPLQFTQALLRVLKDNSYACHKLRHEIWENHLEICNILEPGKTRRRGSSDVWDVIMCLLWVSRTLEASKECYCNCCSPLDIGLTLYQVAVSILAMLKAGVEEREIYLPRVPELLKEAEHKLYEAVDIMQLEPKWSLERNWLFKIQDVINELKDYSTTFESSGCMSAGI